MKTLLAPLLASLVALLLATPAASAKGSLDVEAAQALLDVQQLDGWLIYQNKKQNPIAEALIGPERTQRPWFYWVPAQGKPVALVHRSEVSAFESVVGEKVTYSGTSQIKSRLKKMIGEAKSIAMEYAPASGIASLTRVDARTASIVTGLGATVVSSAELVQFTKSAWGVSGRVSHYVAAHHLSKLIGEASAFIGEKLRAGELITEYDVQQFILAGYKVRGLVGEPPLIATGLSSADPTYRPSAQSARVIKAGDIIQFELAAHIPTDARPIVADVSWVAFAGTAVPAGMKKNFAVLAKARDAAINLIRKRMAQRQEVAGFEADRAARDTVAAAGLGDRFTHRTGHSLDTSLEGDGANLDDHETHDTRKLVVGSGFTVGPGIYLAEDYGMRTEVSIFLAATGVEITSEPQMAIATIRVEK